MNALVRHSYAGVVVLQQSGVCELYENGVLLARTDNTAIADKLFFKRALEIASTRVGVGARAQLTAEGRRAFGCEGVPSPSAERLTPPPEGEAKENDNPSDSPAASHLPLHKGGDEEKPKRKVFKKPTVEEIADYCREKGYTLTEPQAFYDYHESGGWMVGRKKMQDWKAAVRTWEHKEQAYMQERAEREKRYGRSRNSVELTNPPVSSLHLEEFERDLMTYCPKFKSPERSEAV